MRLVALILSLVCINAFAKVSEEELQETKNKADQGDSNAQCSLGLYYKFVSKPKDIIEALKWFRKSAEQGDANGQYYLGNCYDFGEGVIKDQVEAYAYYNLSGITYELARMRRDELEKNLTPSQIEAGIKRAKEIQKEIDAIKNPPWWKKITK